jgi:carbamoylphosphate synthase small subunit
MRNRAASTPPGLIIRDLPLASSNWREEEDLSTYLRRNNVVAIGDIDTRRLTRFCATKGARTAAFKPEESTRRRPSRPPAPRRRWPGRTSRRS